MHLKDVNGYPVFTKREIFENAEIKERAYLFTLDFLNRVRKMRCKIVEVPVMHQERGGGKSFMSPLKITEMVLQFLEYCF